MFHRKDNITQHQAILIEKTIFHTNDSSLAVRKLYQMRRGMYNTHTTKDTNYKSYQMTFMTKSGTKEYYVERGIYQSIKINALGTLTVNRDLFVRFDVEKIATKEDVKALNW